MWDGCKMSEGVVQLCGFLSISGCSQRMFPSEGHPLPFCWVLAMPDSTMTYLLCLGCNSCGHCMVHNGLGPAVRGLCIEAVGWLWDATKFEFNANVLSEAARERSKQMYCRRSQRHPPCCCLLHDRGHIKAQMPCPVSIVASLHRS